MLFISVTKGNVLQWQKLSSCLGKKLLYIINLGTKVNFVYYCNGILPQTISQMIALSGGDLLFQQDGAS